MQLFILMEVQFRSTQNTGLQCLQLAELSTASYQTRFTRQTCNSHNLGTAESGKKGNHKMGIKTHLEYMTGLTANKNYSKRCSKACFRNN